MAPDVAQARAQQAVGAMSLATGAALNQGGWAKQGLMDTGAAVTRAGGCSDSGSGREQSLRCKARQSKVAGVAVQVRQWLCRRGSGCVGHGRLGLEGAGPATRGSGSGYWRLRVWEEIGMKTFGHLPPLFINQLSN